MDFKAVLADTLSPTVSKIQAASSENFSLFVDLVFNLVDSNADSIMSNTLSIEETNIVVAGLLILKNHIVSNDESINKQLEERWLKYTNKQNTPVHRKLMEYLGLPNNRISSAISQLITSIAKIELTLNLWPELIMQLLNNVMTTSINPQQEGQNINNNEIIINCKKQMSLQTIGYICESIKGEVLKAYSSQILTAIAQGAKKEEKKLTALTALINSLEFIHMHFEVETDRNYLMQVICEAAAQQEEPNVCCKALEALVKIVQMYYKYMPAYMEPALIPITINAMHMQDEECVLQAIEFWSTVNEVEINIDTGEEEYVEIVDDNNAQKVNYLFASKQLTQLTQTLLTLMAQQEEFVDEDEWNKSKAAATCLSLLAINIQDDIVDIVVPFIEQNIMNNLWNLREAAIMSFGCIMDGPIPSKLSPYVNEIMPVLVKFIEDTSVEVKDACVWTLGRISEFVIEEIHDYNNNSNISLLVNALLYGLKMNVQIISTCSWALINVAKGLSDLENSNNNSRPGLLSPYYESVLAALINVSDQLNSNNQFNARTSVYEAMSQWIIQAPEDCYHIVSNVALVVISRLEDSILKNNNASIDSQCDLCRVLNTVTYKVGKQIISISDRMMNIYLKILELNTDTNNAVYNANIVIEDCFVCIGTLVISLEDQFTKYLEAFMPYLHRAITMHQNIQLCSIAVGIVGDLSRGLGKAFSNYAKSFVELFLHDLNNTTNTKINMQVKSAIVASFGDIAQEIGQDFGNYIQPTIDSVCELVKKMTTSNNNKQDVLSLKIATLQMFTGIVLGLKNTDSLFILNSYIPQIFSLMHNMYLENINNQQGITAINNYNYYLDEELIQIMVGLIGDLAEAYVSNNPNNNIEIKQQLQNNNIWIKNTIKHARAKRNKETTRKLAMWAREAVKKALQQQ